MHTNIYTHIHIDRIAEYQKNWLWKEWLKAGLLKDIPEGLYRAPNIPKEEVDHARDGRTNSNLKRGVPMFGLLQSDI
jgi:hypothetical protein